MPVSLPVHIRQEMDGNAYWGLSVCSRPSLHQPPLKEHPWGEQGGPMLLLEQYIRKLCSSFSLLQSGEVSKVLEDPKWAVLCSSDHEQKLLPTVVQAS